jgi:hypothetical protein
MTSQAQERLILVAAGGVLARIDTHAHGTTIRTQAAVVRSLVDELDRHLGSQDCSAFLREQIEDELLRLMALVKRGDFDEASSGRASVTRDRFVDDVT